jgi:NAD-dependent DNA ligase
MNPLDKRSGAHQLHSRRIRDRCVVELLGITKGIVADNTVSDAEAVMLRQWIEANPEVTDCWPGNVLHDRLVRVFADGIISEAEREDLTTLLQRAVGESEGSTSAPISPSALPLNDPEPPIEFPEMHYVFTGTFYFGTRERCEAAIAERGGTCGGSITLATNYLVIGTLATGAWQFSTHGRKIEKAIKYREEGAALAIVSEECWVRAMSARR